MFKFTQLNLILLFSVATCAYAARPGEETKRTSEHNINAHGIAPITGLALSLANPVQYPPDDFTVAGIRIGLLVGKHKNVYGLDIGGIGNITESNFIGMAIAGGFNNTRGSTNIILLQLAGLANINSGKTNVYGFQIAPVNWNSGGGSIVGVSLGILVNKNSLSDIYGLQLGLYNEAQAVYGFQIGIINKTKSLHGLQIGLMNFNEAGPLIASPIINIGF